MLRAYVVRVLRAYVVRVLRAYVVRVLRAYVVRVLRAYVVRVLRAYVVRVLRAYVVRLSGCSEPQGYLQALGEGVLMSSFGSMPQGLSDDRDVVTDRELVIKLITGT